MSKWPGYFVFLVTQLKEVVLKSGKVLRADVCVIGAGDVKCTSEYLLFLSCFRCYKLDRNRYFFFKEKQVTIQ